MKKELLIATTDINGKPIGLSWYNYLVRFGIGAGAVINILYSFAYLTGAIYASETNGQVTAEDVYAYYGSALQVMNIIYGLFLIGFGAFALIVREKLSNYEHDALKFIYTYFFLPVGVLFIYYVLEAIVISQFITLNAALSLILGLTMAFINIKYFKKRAHLFFDKTTIQRKSQTTAPITSIHQSLKKTTPFPPKNNIDNVGNYGIIETELTKGFVENARKIIKQQIAKVTNENDLVRKTDLMKLILGYVNREFTDAKGPKTDLIVCAYYQIAFDEIVKLCGGMNDLIFNYAVSKMSDTTNKDIHKYSQMLVKIQSIIDDAIITCKSHNSFHGYLKQLKTQVFNELNSYIDDATDWNKLSPKKESRIES